MTAAVAVVVYGRRGDNAIAPTDASGRIARSSPTSLRLRAKNATLAGLLLVSMAAWTVGGTPSAIYDRQNNDAFAIRKGNDDSIIKGVYCEYSSRGRSDDTVAEEGLHRYRLARGSTLTALPTVPSFADERRLDLAEEDRSSNFDGDSPPPWWGDNVSVCVNCHALFWIHVAVRLECRMTKAKSTRFSDPVVFGPLLETHRWYVSLKDISNDVDDTETAMLAERSLDLRCQHHASRDDCIGTTSNACHNSEAVQGNAFFICRSVMKILVPYSSLWKGSSSDDWRYRDFRHYRRVLKETMILASLVREAHSQNVTGASTSFHRGGAGGGRRAIVDQWLVSVAVPVGRRVGGSKAKLCDPIYPVRLNDEVFIDDAVVDSLLPIEAASEHPDPPDWNKIVVGCIMGVLGGVSVLAVISKHGVADDSDSLDLVDPDGPLLRTPVACSEPRLHGVDGPRYSFEEHGMRGIRLFQNDALRSSSQDDDDDEPVIYSPLCSIEVAANCIEKQPRRDSVDRSLASDGNGSSPSCSPYCGSTLRSNASSERRSANNVHESSPSRSTSIRPSGGPIQGVAPSPFSPGKPPCGGDGPGANGASPKRPVLDVGGAGLKATRRTEACPLRHYSGGDEVPSPHSHARAREALSPSGHGKSPCIEDLGANRDLSSLELPSFNASTASVGLLRQLEAYSPRCYSGENVPPFLYSKILSVESEPDQGSDEQVDTASKDVFPLGYSQEQLDAINDGRQLGHVQEQPDENNSSLEEKTNHVQLDVSDDDSETSCKESRSSSKAEKNNIEVKSPSSNSNTLSLDGVQFDTATVMPELGREASQANAGAEDSIRDTACTPADTSTYGQLDAANAASEFGGEACEENACTVDNIQDHGPSDCSVLSFQDKSGHEQLADVESEISRKAHEASECTKIVIQGTPPSPHEDTLPLGDYEQADITNAGAKIVCVATEENSDAGSIIQGTEFNSSNSSLVKKHLGEHLDVANHESGRDHDTNQADVSAERSLQDKETCSLRQWCYDRNITAEGNGGTIIEALGGSKNCIHHDEIPQKNQAGNAKSKLSIESSEAANLVPETNVTACSETHTSKKNSRLDSPPKIDRIVVKKKSPYFPHFDPFVETNTSTSVNEGQVLACQGSKLQISPKGSINPSVSSSAVTTRTHNGKLEAPPANHNSKRIHPLALRSCTPEEISSRCSFSIIRKPRSSKRRRRSPKEVARVSTSPIPSSQLHVGQDKAQIHWSKRGTAQANRDPFFHEDDSFFDGNETSSRVRIPLATKPAPSSNSNCSSPMSTTPATVNNFTAPSQNIRIDENRDRPLPIPCGAVGQRKRLGASSSHMNSENALHSEIQSDYVDLGATEECEPFNLSCNPSGGPSWKRLRSKKRSRSIMKKLLFTKKSTMHKPSTALVPLSQKMEKPAWQFSC